jgi:hypothetical protein
LRKHNRQFLDYGTSGYIGLAIKKEKTAWKNDYAARRVGRYDQSKEEGPEKDYFYTCLFPADVFLSILADPVGFSTRLENDAEGVMEEWTAINKGAIPFDRVTAERCYPLHEHSFRDPKAPRGVEERSIYEMQISTYGFNERARKVDYPEPMVLRDMKVSLLAPTIY